MENAEQAGLALVEKALDEGRISKDQARIYTKLLVPEEVDVDIFSYRSPEIHESRASVAAAAEALRRHLASQERTPRAGIAAVFSRRKAVGKTNGAIR